MIYILKLENNKYYVGKSNNMQQRAKAHFSQNGSEWTKKYPPIEIMETIEDKEEDMVTIDTMYTYGIENVRGGSYSRIHLSNEDIRSIQKLICTKYDLCYNCGEKGCFILQCKNRNRSHSKFKFPPQLCTRCGRSNHTRKNCYAKKHVNGNTLNDASCTRCGRSNHIIKDCYAKKDISGKPIVDKLCGRCGRNTHDVNNCYETKDVFDREITYNPGGNIELESAEKRYTFMDSVMSFGSYIYNKFYAKK